VSPQPPAARRHLLPRRLHRGIVEHRLRPARHAGAAEDRPEVPGGWVVGHPARW